MSRLAPRVSPRACKSQPLPRRPPVPLSGDLEQGLKEHAASVGCARAFELGLYHTLTKDKAAHGPSLAKNPELAGGLTTPILLLFLTPRPLAPLALALTPCHHLRPPPHP
eukprot:9477857-Pyramimonas_sp.AAC.1